jgi:hypothetical protein
VVLYNPDFKELIYIVTSCYFILTYKAGLDTFLLFFKLLIIYREDIINIEEYGYLTVIEDIGILRDYYKAELT